MAAEMYVDYRRLRPDWPGLPPPGLRFAVDPQSAGLTVYRSPQVVSLDVPQTGQSASSVPSFLADPYLDLDNSRIRNSILKQGVGESAFEVAKELQARLQDQTRLDEFGADAALIPQDHQQAGGYDQFATFGQGTWTASAFLPPSAYGSPQPQSYTAPAATPRTQLTPGKAKAPQR